MKRSTHAIFRTLLSAVLALSTSASWAANGSAVIHDKDPAKNTLLFRFSRTEAADGSSSRNVYSDTQGQEAVTEEMSFDQGRLTRYSLTQKQLDEKGLLEVRDGKLHFSYTRGGKTETDEEKLPSNLVIGPTLIPFMQAHWQELLQGKTVELRYGVLERKETVGFKIFKTEEKKSPSGKDLIVLKMKPTSFVIAAIVDPILFTFEKESLRPLEILGRTLPKQKVDGKWKDLDARFVFQP